MDTVCLSSTIQRPKLRLSDICEVPSSSLAFFSDDAVDSLCQRLGHDKLKTLVNTLEDTMKARWQAAEAANNRPQTEDWSHCDVHRPLYIQGLPPLSRSGTSLLTDAQLIFSKYIQSTRFWIRKPLSVELLMKRTEHMTFLIKPGRRSTMP
jgi:hypothetical protein